MHCTEWKPVVGEDRLGKQWERKRSQRDRARKRA